jgi:hypothetical protein
VKQWKHETIEYYYDIFLQLCVVIPQQPDDVYMKETFKERLKNKLKISHYWNAYSNDSQSS